MTAGLKPAEFVELFDPVRLHFAYVLDCNLISDPGSVNQKKKCTHTLFPPVANRPTYSLTHVDLPMMRCNQGTESLSQFVSQPLNPCQSMVHRRRHLLLCPKLLAIAGTLINNSNMHVRCTIKHHRHNAFSSLAVLHFKKKNSLLQLLLPDGTWTLRQGQQAQVPEPVATVRPEACT